MKWSNRIQIVTGQTCVHISLHLLLIAALVWGWKHQALVQVSMVLLAMYSSVFVAMMLTQRIPRLRNLGDFLEDVTTTYYFGAAMLVLLLLSRVIHNNLLLGGIGVLMVAGPAVVSLLAKEPARNVEKKRG
ncbi:YbhQ family protein [Erwiniaceae bacterium BAC15a-03b]|uniref:YbhQ family protein n=1 Tax=Winslowiella arboricola TaxID=2978220 RepID=A0A9J6Q345_9GAMM|nr:YbhQ family protein [Winslowiella arboricola]MCU5772885.1 YbhQ family protein [Winslowiella arboricola]MCU5780687.1 YbhQ family protein [Winslowiella arboricola]